MEKGNKIVRNIVFGFLMVMAFLFAISISSSDSVSLLEFWKTLGAQILFLVISALIYSFPAYQGTLLGINTKTIGLSLFLGTAIGIAYLVIASLVPGFAIATPLIPASIGSSLRFFVVVIVSPIVETIFFLGALLGYIRTFNPSKKHLFVAIIIQSLAFSLFHLGAYLTGIYSLSASAGFLGFTQNISVFISAFIFGTLAGYLVYLKKVQSLAIAMVIHLMINLFAYLSLSISFA
jgi:membrane protease YdiL (CAAX protease family)